MLECNGCVYKNCQEMQAFCSIEGREPDREILPECFCLEERYILKYMKRGGYSNIYYAFDLKRKELVLVKEFYIDELYIGRDENGFLIPDEAEKDRLDKKLNLFIKETKKMNQLRKVQSIPKMFDYICKNGNAFIVMEYIKGTNIYNMTAETSHDILKKFKPLVKDLIIMHNNNIIHRDIYFHNIIYQDGKMRLVDLGIAKRIHHDNLSINDSDPILTELLETKMVSPGKPVEHRNHSYQDSRTDIYSLAKVILDVYEFKEIAVPGKVKKVLDRSMSDNIEERYDSKQFYDLIYGRNERVKKSMVIFLAIFLAMFFAAIALYCIADNMLSGDSRIEEEEVQEKAPSEDVMKARIEAKSGCPVGEDYTGYADFDGDGRNELYTLLPIEIDSSTLEGEAEWINYGEIWFCDEEEVVKVDELGADDIAEGGIYTTEVIQVGAEYHFEVNKYYGLVASAKGPGYLYACRDGQPQKIHEGDSSAPTVANGDTGEETYLIDSKYKFSTDGTGRTYDKIYTYYKDGEYVVYKSELMELSDLYEYENFEELILECAEDIYVKRSLGAADSAEEITEYTEQISGRPVKVYVCVNDGSEKYISLVNCYLNESGRVYLNLTYWEQKEELLESRIWDETNPYYPDPVESFDLNQAYPSESYNYYITFKIRKNYLEIESINEGYWEKHYADDDFTGEELFN